MADGTPLGGATSLAVHTGIASRRTTAIVLAVAAFAVLLRSFVYLYYEQLAFDSDQAITGLMAKHLAEGRAFPLFFYGQTYMLAVEAWVAAPVFLLAGPTVTSLRVSLLAWNIAFACMLIVTLHRDNRLNPWMALVPALMFLLAPASVASRLMEAQGGIVEPYVYIGGLWLLRKRPLWFGALLGVGFRNREFVAYAVPSVLVVELFSGETTRARVRDWLAAAVVFVGLWQVVEALKPFADLLGPGTRGQLIGGFLGSQIRNLIDRFDFAYAAVPERAARIGPEILKWFSGAGQVDTALPLTDRGWMTVAAGAFLAVIGGRLAVLILRPAGDGGDVSWRSLVAGRVRRANFSLYLMIVGALAIVVFIAGKPVLPGYSRYALLGVVFPVGLTAALLSLERVTFVRGSVVALVVAWAVLSAGDHLSIAAAYIKRPPPKAARIVADELVAEGVQVASAGYWRAYTVTFLARERLRVASQDFVRIQEYQDEFLEKLQQAVIISDYPCANGRLVGGLYICRP